MSFKVCISFFVIALICIETSNAGGGPSCSSIDVATNQLELNQLTSRIDGRKTSGLTSLEAMHNGGASESNLVSYKNSVLNGNNGDTNGVAQTIANNLGVLLKSVKDILDETVTNSHFPLSCLDFEPVKTALENCEFDLSERIFEFFE